MNRSPNTYEQSALRNIAAYKDRLAVGGPLAKGSSASSALAWLLRHGAAIAGRIMRPSSVLDAYRRNGYRGVRRIEDIHHLSLQEVDRVADDVGDLAPVVAAAAVGGISGALGPIGMVADVPVASGVALLAISRCAVLYGYDPREPAEHDFAVEILHRSHLDLAPLENAMETAVGSGVARRAAVRMGTQRFTRMLFVVGAVVGATLNAITLRRVTETARMLYRERFLRDRYGTSMLPRINVRMMS
jgi:hypothetical protein